MIMMMFILCNVGVVFKCFSVMMFVKGGLMWDRIFMIGFLMVRVFNIGRMVMWIL